jgi:hypothetical protein
MLFGLDFLSPRVGTLSSKSRSEKLKDVPTNFAAPRNRAGEGFLAKAERARMMAEVAAKLEEQFSSLQLKESCGPEKPAPSQPTGAQEGERARLTRGQIVEVRTAREIAATLDGDGKLDGLPFMPEMAVHCGRRFRVFRRADITCVEGYGLRRMNDAVFLEDVRCDGSAHDGCQRHCLIFWKEAWLKPVDVANSPLVVNEQSERASVAALVSLPTREKNRYLCQSTILATATTDLPSWNVLPFVSQVRDEELTVTRFIQIIALALLNQVRKFLGFKDVGRLTGLKSKSSKEDLGLQPGEWVRVKSHEEIKQTLDSAGRNRGLLFEPEMSEYSGKCFQMDFSIRRMIHEETGEMINLNNTVVLKGLTCQGLCAKSCPRSNYWFWREDWLDRAPPCGCVRDPR